jgi:hypothetical protein
MQRIKLQGNMIVMSYESQSNWALPELKQVWI